MIVITTHEAMAVARPPAPSEPMPALGAALAGAYTERAVAFDDTFAAAAGYLDDVAPALREIRTAALIATVVGPALAWLAQALGWVS